MNRLIWAPALCLALGAAGVVRAAAPQVEADPSRDYPVTPEAGPWMICASYFTGPSAPDLAHQMVLLIRGQHNLPAYVFNYAEAERKRQEALWEQHEQGLPFAKPDPDGGEVVPIPHHKLQFRVEEQCAVLIGGYPDESAAHAALLAVKKLPTPELKVPPGVLPFGSIYDRDGKERMLNPFSSQSMVVRNPAVPRETREVSKASDPFLKTLNADEEFSMLRCPQKWTLAVKEYMGAAMVQQSQAESSKFLKMLGMGTGNPGESLVVAAANAHELARVLRQLQFDAYVLHTRGSSVVSVGGFSGPDDPEVEHLRGRLATLQQQMAAAAKDASKKDPLGLFAIPVPIEVPHP